MKLFERPKVIYITSYELEERRIMEENPYNWKKHFLFQLPELLFWCIRIVLIFLFGETLIISIAVAVLNAIANGDIKIN